MEKSNKKYILLKDLEIYQLARELSKIGWEIYQKLDWKTKKINGDQFIEATDSIGANIAAVSYTHLTLPTTPYV